MGEKLVRFALIKVQNFSYLRVWESSSLVDSLWHHTVESYYTEKSFFNFSRGHRKKKNSTEMAAWPESDDSYLDFTLFKFYFHEPQDLIQAKPVFLTALPGSFHQHADKFSLSKVVVRCRCGYLSWVPPWHFCEISLLFWNTLPVVVDSSGTGYCDAWPANCSFELIGRQVGAIFQHNAGR